MKTKLSVNVNKIALLRNTRTIGIPDVLKFSRIALEAGAAGITIHPRPDQRHVRADDVPALAALMRAWPDREFNIEGNPFHNLMEAVKLAKPHQCTLVPDETGQFTSDHGWDLDKDGARLQPIIEELNAMNVRVSLFMDPVPENMTKAKALGADRIELYTEPYAKFFGTPDEQKWVDAYAATAVAAAKLGLGVNAGHDLNLQNLSRFVRDVPNVLEVSIGHALIADAIEFGLNATVKKYLSAIDAGFASTSERK
jgi:pyridoxine 5-phosphate synthase